MGVFAVQLAARRGARVIACTSAENAAFVRGLGASEIVDYEVGDVVDQVRALAPDGVAAVVDNYHDAAGLVPYATLVRPGGAVVSPVAMGAEQSLADLPVTFHLVQAAVDRAGELGAMAARGELTVPVETYPFEQAADALDRQATRQSRGKLVLIVGP